MNYDSKYIHAYSSVGRPQGLMPECNATPSKVLAKSKLSPGHVALCYLTKYNALRGQAVIRCSAELTWCNATTPLRRCSRLPTPVIPRTLIRSAHPQRGHPVRARRRYTTVVTEGRPTHALAAYSFSNVHLTCRTARGWRHSTGWSHCVSGVVCLSVVCPSPVRLSLTIASPTDQHAAVTRRVDICHLSCVPRTLHRSAHPSINGWLGYNNRPAKLTHCLSRGRQRAGNWGDALWDDVTAKG